MLGSEGSWRGLLAFCEVISKKEEAERIRRGEVAGMGAGGGDGGARYRRRRRPPGPSQELRRRWATRGGGGVAGSLRGSGKFIPGPPRGSPLSPRIDDEREIGRGAPGGGVHTRPSLKGSLCPKWGGGGGYLKWALPHCESGRPTR